MRRTKIVTAFAVITSLTACGPPSEWFKVKRTRTDFHTTQQTTVPAPKPSCATEDDTSVAPGVAPSHRDVNIERVFQRIIRKNCDGTQKSDQIETVSSPNAGFDIPLAGAAAVPRLSADVTNRTTCNSIIRSASGGRIEFTVDTSPALFY